MEASWKIVIFGKNQCMRNTVALEKKLLTCDDYHAMIAAGILDEEDKVELLCGELIFKAPKTSLHAGTVNRINQLLHRLLDNQCIVSAACAVKLEPFSELEPDLSILKYRDDFYSEAHPVPADTFFIIEVADTTLEKGRTVKAPLYAGGNVPFYWIVNLPEMQLEVYSQPAKDQYKLRRIYLPDEKVEIPPFGIEIEVEKLFGASL